MNKANHIALLADSTEIGLKNCGIRSRSFMNLLNINYII